MRRMLATALAGAMMFSGLAFTSAEVTDAVIVDPAGDANGLNGQGLEPGMGDNQGNSQDWADFTHLRIVPGNITTEVRLGVSSLNPSAPVIFRAMTDLGGCAVWFQITNYDGPVGSIRLTSDCGDALTGTYTDGVTVELDEETSEYVMAIKFKSIPAELKPFVKAGAKGFGMELSSRMFIGAGGTGATIPQMDDAEDLSAAFKL